MIKLIWKLIPKKSREALLARIPAMDRSPINKILSGNVIVPEDFIQRECIFIHIPKCAGTSIRQALFTSHVREHVPLWFYEKNFPEFYSRAFKFAFVRDPLKRAYSAYFYLRDMPCVKRDAAAHQLVRKYDDFDKFVKHWVCEENVTKQIHFVPQWQFICDSLGDIGLDFIGRQESINADFQHICGKLGVEARLPVANASVSQVEEMQVSSATIDRIRRVYARDYEVLGY